MTIEQDSLSPQCCISCVIHTVSVQWVHLAVFLCHEAKHFVCCGFKNAWCSTNAPTYLCPSCARKVKLYLQIYEFLVFCFLSVFFVTTG
jgi:hypothetical protein